MRWNLNIVRVGWLDREYHDLMVEDDRVAKVSRLSNGRYCWAAENERLGITLRHCPIGKEYEFSDDAKADCRAYVEECLKKAKVGK